GVDTAHCAQLPCSHRTPVVDTPAVRTGRSRCAVRSRHDPIGCRTPVRVLSPCLVRYGLAAGRAVTACGGGVRPARRESVGHLPQPPFGERKQELSSVSRTGILALTGRGGCQRRSTVARRKDVARANAKSDRIDPEWPATSLRRSAASGVSS